MPTRTDAGFRAAASKELHQVHKQRSAAKAPNPPMNLPLFMICFLFRFPPENFFWQRGFKATPLANEQKASELHRFCPLLPIKEKRTSSRSRAVCHEAQYRTFVWSGLTNSCGFADLGLPPQGPELTTDCPQSLSVSIKPWIGPTLGFCKTGHQELGKAFWPFLSIEITVNWSYTHASKPQSNTTILGKEPNLLGCLPQTSLEAKKINSM